MMKLVMKSLDRLLNKILNFTDNVLRDFINIYGYIKMEYPNIKLPSLLLLGIVPNATVVEEKMCTW